MLLEQWREWQSCTDRELIWHWFDRSHSAGGVALMFPVEVGGLPIVRKEYSDCQKVVLRLL